MSHFSVNLRVSTSSLYFSQVPEKVLKRSETSSMNFWFLFPACQRMAGTDIVPKTFATCTKEKMGGTKTKVQKRDEVFAANANAERDRTMWPKRKSILGAAAYTQVRS